jgi:hypothetical protein
MGAFGQKMPQPLQRLGDRVRPRDANDVEAVLVRGRGERSLERRRIAQKSRSA